MAPTEGPPVEPMNEAQLLNAALESMTYGFSIWDENLQLTRYNDQYLRMHGWDRTRIHLGMTLRELCVVSIAAGNHPGLSIEDVYAERRARFVDSHRPSAVGRYEKTVRGRHYNSVYRRRPGVGWVVTHQDVTEEVQLLQSHRAREKELRLQNLRLDAAVNNMSQGLCMFDAFSKLVICNKTYGDIYGLPAELLRPGTELDDMLDWLFNPETGRLEPAGGPEDLIGERRKMVRDGQPHAFHFHFKDGRIISVNDHPMADGGWVSTHEDVTERHRTQELVRHLARHDALTGLPNRYVFQETMGQAEARMRRGEHVALLCIDLDGFKAVNDTYGHAAGDALLAETAARLQSSSREHELVARLGGDEFALLVGPLERPDQAAIVAERVAGAVAAPFAYEGRELVVRASFGIAVAPEDGEDSETLMRNADLALYRAKAQGRGGYCFFEKGMDEATHRRRAFEAGLRDAIGSLDQFAFMFQPIVRLTDNTVCSMEALMRWTHPELGAIGPDEFIPVAEESGLINLIGERALFAACRAAASWPGHLPVAVNMSPVQFRDGRLIERVEAALSAAGLPPDRLELEITESLLLAEHDETLELLHGLRALGVKVSMDDFGAGYSSLSYLGSFPFDKVKIDRFFIRDLMIKRNNRAIVQAVIQLCQTLGISAIAEGVETEAQRQALRDDGCAEGQGFLFSPPLTEAGACALLERLEGRAILADASEQVLRVS